MKIGYYFSTAKAERNQGIYVLYNFDCDWPESTLAQRALCGNRVLSREAHPHEVEVVAENKRAVSYRYTSLAGLIADERSAGTDEETIDRIQREFASVKEPI